jgi:hypothetical protein
MPRGRRKKPNEKMRQRYWCEALRTSTFDPDFCQKRKDHSPDHAQKVLSQFDYCRHCKGGLQKVGEVDLAELSATYTPPKKRKHRGGERFLPE